MFTQSGMPVNRYGVNDLIIPTVKRIKQKKHLITLALLGLARCMRERQKSKELLAHQL